MKRLALMALLVASSARAQVTPVFSAGASLPMLEFLPQQTHPVQFAPGLGVEGAVGLFQFTALGKQWDALNLSAQAFGNSPGALQGQFHVYPVLSLNIPIAFGPFAPQVGVGEGPRALPRGGTLFLGAP